MKNEILFIRKNTAHLVGTLTAELKLKHSELCNEGIYVCIENGIVMEVNHVPYSKHIEFDTEEELVKYIRSKNNI